MSGSSIATATGMHSPLATLGRFAAAAVFSALALGSAGLGCSVESAGETVAVDDADLFVDTQSIWPNPTATPVCWTNPQDSAAMAWVQDAVAESWSAHSPVRFVGWGPCPAVGPAMVRIQI